MVMALNPNPYKWFINGYGLAGQNIRPETPYLEDGVQTSNTSLIHLKKVNF